MTKKKSPHKRDARALQRATGMPYTAALAQVQRTEAPAPPCPGCGSYDVTSEHGGGSQPVASCNACDWTDR